MRPGDLSERASGRPEDLISRILELSRMMRRAGAGTSISQGLAAVQGLRLIDLPDREDFKSLLRTALVSSKDENPVFEYYFELLFNPGLDKTPPAMSDDGRADQPVGDGRDGRTEVEPDRSGSDSDQPKPLPVGATRHENFLKRDFARMTPEEAREARRLTLVLTRRLALGLKNRFKAGGRSRKLDFRRTIRRSLQTGGELIDLRRRRRRPRPHRVLTLADVSGSMDIYTRFFLTFMYGLTEALPRVESFVFSTRLARLTPLLRTARPEQVMTRLLQSGPPLSGGTTIGPCLKEFLLGRQASFLSERTLVLLLSDGWDRGDIGVLEKTMAEFKRRSAGILWLNPLAADPGFEPLARGMAAALPFIEGIYPFSRLTDIVELGKRLGD